MDLRACIRDIPDYPKPGILFKDITPLLKEPAAFKHAVELLADACRAYSPDLIAAVEARGFIFGSAIAEKLKLGFIPVRKKGKLPYKTIEESYALEYGTDTLTMHEDAVGKGQRVVIIDDLLATGGTVGAAARLLGKAGAVVAGAVFLIELDFLTGRQKLQGLPVTSFLHF